jgi:hypothetical protein
LDQPELAVIRRAATLLLAAFLGVGGGIGAGASPAGAAAAKAPGAPGSLGVAGVAAAPPSPSPMADDGVAPALEAESAAGVSPAVAAGAALSSDALAPDALASDALAPDALAPLGPAASPAAESDAGTALGPAVPPLSPAISPETPLVGPVLPSAPSSGALYSRLGSLSLYDLPGAADPWAVLPRTPGVSMTNAYVAGYGVRPGQASVGPGSTGDQGVFRIDGFEIGDAASPTVPLGMSSLTSEEVQVTTGGADLAALAPGLQINLVERRGTNEWRASLRGFGSGGPLTAGAPRVHGLPAGQAASERVSGDRVRDAGAVGAELGGPLLQDAVWIWGGLDRGWSALEAFGGQPFSSSDLGGAVKLDARLPGANSATMAWNRANRGENGEGAGPDRARETTLDRRAHDEVWRLADTAILSPSLYATATAGLVKAADSELPRGGLDVPLLLDPAGVSHGSWYADDEQRSTRAASWQLSESGQLGGAASELRLAGEWRRTNEASHWAAPAWAQATAGQVLELPPGQDALALWRNGNTRDTLTRMGLWLGDTLSWSRATATFGLRYDQQTPRNLASSVPGVPGDPLLHAVDFAGNDADGVRWRSLVPRLAVAYEPAGAHRLLLRASLARYAAQLGGAIPARVDPAAPASAAWYVPAGVTSLDAGNLQDGVSFWYPNGFDPRLPPGVPANVLDRRLRPELTDELILGAEQPLGTDGSVGLRLLYRRVTRILEDRLLVRDASDAVMVANAGDWVQAGVAAGTLPNGAPFASPYYDLRPGLTPTGGTLLVNGDRQQRLLGVALEWRQRLAGRWTTRGHLTWQDWRWRLGPLYQRYADPTYALLDGNYAGQPVAGQSPVPGGRPVYLSGRWSFDLSGVVQLPGAFSAAAELTGRQGVPLPYYQTVARDRAGPVDVRAAELVDAFRSDNLVSLDARIDKQFDLGSDVALAVSLEALNLLAAGQVLRRETNLGVTRANFVDEVVAPRVLRLGLKLQFR